MKKEKHIKKLQFLQRLFSLLTQSSNILQKLIVVAYVLIALFVVATLFYGMIFLYVPIPFWDEWDSYLGFFLNDDSFKSWFAQHNEHKIVFSRLLFWLGFYVFGKSLSIQIMFIFFIQFVNVSLISYIIFKQSFNKYFKVILIACVFIVGFSWIQRENFMWSFQTAFVGVLMNASLSYMFLYWYSNTQKRVFVILSILFLFLTTFTLASGALASLLFIALAWYFRTIKKSLKMLLSFIAVAFMYLYFNDFNSPAGHASPYESLFEHPYDVYKYSLRYIAAPFHFFYSLDGGIAISLIGFMIQCLFFYGVVYVIRKKKTGYGSLVMLSLSGYGFLMAFVTGMGRINFGLEQAMSSRYQTVALLTLLSLALFYIIEFKKNYVKVFVIVLFSSFIPRVVSDQRNVISDFKSLMFERKREFLAFKMGIVSPTFTSVLYPVHKDVNQYKNYFEQGLLSFEMLSPNADNLNDSLTGFVDKVSHLQTDNRYFFICGWAYGVRTKSSPNAMAIVHPKSQDTVGYVVFGRRRDDVKLETGNGEYSGFEGYVSDTSYLPFPKSYSN